MNRVAVRIVRRGSGWLVVGRKTTVECASFDEAWEVSVPYFAGRRCLLHAADGRVELVPPPVLIGKVIELGGYWNPDEVA